MAGIEGRPLVGFAVGSDSDFEVVDQAEDVFDEFGIKCEWAIKSAHRTHEAMAEWGESAADRGLEVIIAAAGGSAHLPGMLVNTTDLPVLGVAVDKKYDPTNAALGSMVEMPYGAPLAYIGKNQTGAKNAALFAVRMVGIKYPELREATAAFREKNRGGVIVKDNKLHEMGFRAYREMRREQGGK